MSLASPIRLPLIAIKQVSAAHAGDFRFIAPIQLRDSRRRHVPDTSAGYCSHQFLCVPISER